MGFEDYMAGFVQMLGEKVLWHQMVRISWPSYVLAWETANHIWKNTITLFVTMSNSPEMRPGDHVD